MAREPVAVPSPQPEPGQHQWHSVRHAALSVALLSSGERRLEAENYLSSGFGLRLLVESKGTGWKRLSELASVWQPSRLKGIQVSSSFGTPFLGATQVFAIRPTPRKWLALERTSEAHNRFVDQGTILVTCSGSVGQSIQAHALHRNVLISHDLLRVKPTTDTDYGWLFAFLQSRAGRAMMLSAHYGHVVKHLEPMHLAALPIPNVEEIKKASLNGMALNALRKRNEAYQRTADAETIFERAVAFESPVDRSPAFDQPVAALARARRRLEANFYSPEALAILHHFESKGLKAELLRSLTGRVWWMTRFKRVFGASGIPYLSADDLFTLNPTLEKRIMTDLKDNADEFLVEPGWLLMACSGQTYGLNGSVILVTEARDECFVSHDVIRIAPDTRKIRPGYLSTVLSHPTLGRPLVIRNAYGSSVPHLDPDDISAVPVVRLGERIEGDIADAAEQAAVLHDQASRIERDMAEEADRIVSAFCN